MKKLILIFLPLLIFSCKNGESPSAVTKEPSNTANFDWLLGDWERTNEQEDRQTFESWSKKDNSEYNGFGFTLQNNDTIWQETIKLVELNGSWNFEATGKGEIKPTVFKLTNIDRKRTIYL